MLMFVIDGRVLTGLQDRGTQEAVIEEETAAGKDDGDMPNFIRTAGGVSLLDAAGRAWCE